MATPATMNRWLDELSLSIINNGSTKKQNSKRLQDTFRRRVRKHNYARTNQFEVEERFDGLEEKFQILTLDNLSDALRQRRNELKDFEHHWLPDVLDLFLHLSGDPARNENLLELYRVPPRIGTPPPLRWKDLLAESPIDKHDRLWRVPDFHDTDDSGYDDNFSSSPAVSTPSPKQRRDHQHEHAIFNANNAFQEVILDQHNHFIPSLSTSKVPDFITEEHFIREILFFIRGYSSQLFTFKRERYILNSDVQVRGFPKIAVQEIAQQTVAIRLNLDRVHNWIQRPTQQSYIVAMKEAAELVVRQYHKAVDELQQNFVDPDHVVAISVIQVMNQIDTICTRIKTLAIFVKGVDNSDAVSCLEFLYSAVQSAQLCNEIESYHCLRTLLLSSLRAYLYPVWIWLTEGRLDHADSFFIQEFPQSSSLNTIWHSRFTLIVSGPHRPPNFLDSSTQRILACGKTLAFLHRLHGEWNSREGGSKSELATLLDNLGADNNMSFAASFEHNWDEQVTSFLTLWTARLKATLSEQCGFDQTFHGLNIIYLGQSALVLDDLEVKLFNRVDRCMDNWNDRFQLRGMIDETCTAHGMQHITDALSIHSAYTSSRTMQSRRKSVKILSSLAFEYNLSWPIANIIGSDAMTAYRRIALVLMQVRRAKYCLERTGYMSAMMVPLGESASLVDQKFAQILAFTLLSFVNTLYAHLTSTTIEPLTGIMLHEMQHATTIDEMINIHQKYITRLACSCLAAPKVKVLRQTLIAILDMCIRFSDLVSNPTKEPNADSDHEASSFMSAMSRNKSLRADQYGSDSDNDDDDARNMTEGYSSFIVLGDDTTIVKELRKLRAQYIKQMKFFTAGLRGVGRAGQHVQDLEALADRLDWNQTR